jgi:drug/metabolite transporter (DMT)-like permease
MTGVGYILAAVLGAFFLKEPVSAARWMGVLLIFAGTSLVAATSQKTESRE